MPDDVVTDVDELDEPELGDRHSDVDEPSYGDPTAPEPELEDDDRLDLQAVDVELELALDDDEASDYSRQ